MNLRDADVLVVIGFRWQRTGTLLNLGYLDGLFVARLNVAGLVSNLNFGNLSAVVSGHVL